MSRRGNVVLVRYKQSEESGVMQSVVGMEMWIREGLETCGRGIR